jgi:hypothetical protein
MLVDSCIRSSAAMLLAAMLHSVVKIVVTIGTTGLVIPSSMTNGSLPR